MARNEWPSKTVLRPLAQLSAPPVFIVGFPRSGTTWVADIFDAHPQASVVYESYLFSREAGLAVFTDAKHWKGPTGVGALMRRDELIRDVREVSTRWLARALDTNDRYLIEKTPSHLDTVDFIAEVFPRAHFIHVLRDGRDVAVSIRSAAGSWAPQWKRTFGRSIFTSAKAWADAVAFSRGASRRLGDRWFEIRYEYLASEPLGAYAALFEFCGVQYDAALLRTIVDRTDFRRVHRGGEGAFYRRGEPGDWKRNLELFDSLRFEMAAGRMLRELGYETSTRWWLRRRQAT
jgi:hypothetical protein